MHNKPIKESLVFAIHHAANNAELLSVLEIYKYALLAAIAKQSGIKFEMVVKEQPEPWEE